MQNQHFLSSKRQSIASISSELKFDLITAQRPLHTEPASRSPFQYFSSPQQQSARQLIKNRDNIKIFQKPKEDKIEQQKSESNKILRDNNLKQLLLRNQQIKKTPNSSVVDEGSVLVQQIPVNKKVNASGQSSCRDQQTQFTIKNRDTGQVIDVRKYEQTKNWQQIIQNVPQSVKLAQNNKIQEEYKSIWTQRLELNTEILKYKKKNERNDGLVSNIELGRERVGPGDFVVHGLIGKGSFGEVYLVEKRGTGNIFAMKVLHKSQIEKQNLTRYAITERNILSSTNHPFIVRLRYAFQTIDKLFLILDYCPGGDLSEHLQREKRFSEERVKLYMTQLILALEDLHKRDIVFRDLKPDNIVLDADGYALLTDFGLSKEGVLEQNSGARSFCGSVAYLAPEMLKRGGHGKAVDWYLLGVVMYEFLVGIPPYYAVNKDELFNNIERGQLKIPSYISVEGKNLLKSLLQRNPAKRLGSGKGDSEEIKSHQYFNDVIWQDVFNRRIIMPRIIRKIKIRYQDSDIFEQSPSQIGEHDSKHLFGWSFIDLLQNQAIDH